MRKSLKTLAFLTVLLGFVTAIVVLVTEGLKLYREFLTPTPALTTVTSSGTLLFEEDFEDSKAQLFQPNNGGNWKFVTEDTGNVVYDLDNTGGTDFPDVKFGSTDWANYATEYRVKILKKSGIAVILHFRESADRWIGYIQSFLADTNEVVLAYKLDSSGWQRLQTKPLNLEIGQWYSVRVEAKGMHIQVFVDNYLISDVTDSRIRAGALSLSVGPDTHVQFDDIRVYSLDE